MTTALATPVAPTVAHPGERSSCPHQPPCPTAASANRDAARIIASFPEQGWALHCNGVISFDDGGDLLQDGTSIAPPDSFPARHRGSR